MGWGAGEGGGIVTFTFIKASTFLVSSPSFPPLFLARRELLPCPSSLSSELELLLLAPAARLADASALSKRARERSLCRRNECSNT